MNTLIEVFIFAAVALGSNVVVSSGLSAGLPACVVVVRFESPSSMTSGQATSFAMGTGAPELDATQSHALADTFSYLSAGLRWPPYSRYQESIQKTQNDGREPVIRYADDLQTFFTNVVPEMG